MSWTALICLGASDGPRAENLLDAAAQLLAEPDAALAAASELYGDRHRLHAGGATLNLVLAVEWQGASQPEALERRFKRIEAGFGRERDPRRRMPVPLDIDLLGALDAGGSRWQARYDPGRGYLFHGLSQLPLPPLQAALDALQRQRGFRGEDNAHGFYAYAGAAFVRRYLLERAAQLRAADGQRETG
ncbi:2-amino-4-hydroxy-6-hydroxymethyldihydropteridine diphosphokinase [Lysobacter sp. K5869]|uniref:2-amino-4-hydroxy-6- hydroxymethyldihydropteridine diphosphokinase n=1 Tax=Lysobacter sp. K5869 TaxID=2820808 RepID=UPI001C063335|nr:2-amino-4-hydroxy-6-hydroxymethyldihydropteridine diphosphokinase [Lysobacter sp. K5869]QWP74935.1 2-amino-4-hydroxy-6-hydroxymethyldihydropteridine diphosphokinase [Lysobacter sp. K5869]